MALFDFGKKKAEEREPVSRGPAPEECAAGPARIQVLGSGCKNCHALLESTQEAVRSMGLDVQVEYVTDMARIAASGVMRMPALMVDGRAVSVGRVLKAAQVEALLRERNF